MHVVKTRCIGRSALLGLLFVLAPADALSWSQRVQIAARVHNHVFDDVSIESSGCTLNLALYFTAPEGGYRDPNAAVRNHYRFDARVSLSEGRKFHTGVFQNTQPGRRRFRHAHDTASEGCWAKQELKLRAVDIEGCRNRRCKVPSFK
jgi:hypothetical protein